MSSRRAARCCRAAGRAMGVRHPTGGGFLSEVTETVNDELAGDACRRMGTCALDGWAAPSALPAARSSAEDDADAMRAAVVRERDPRRDAIHGRAVQLDAGDAAGHAARVL